MESLIEIPIHSQGSYRKNPRTGNKQLMYIEISFGRDVQDLKVLTFENYYTASISIAMLSPSPGVGGGFISVPVIPSKTIMPRPDCEAQGESLCVVPVTEFQTPYVRGHPLRIHIYQPSVLWNVYEIRNIKAYAARSQSAGAAGSAASSTDSTRPPTVATGILGRIVASDISALLTYRKKELQNMKSASSSSSGVSAGAEYSLPDGRRGTSKKKEKRKMRPPP